MTVIAWDGVTLAADKRACLGSFMRSTTKIHRVNGCLVGTSGEACFGEQMIAWFRAGEKAEDFPASQRDKDDYANLLVIRPSGQIQRYERTPYPICFDDAHHAIGSGRDFAMAAMLCGKNAAEAVAIACELACDCGGGVDTLRLES